MLRLPNKHRRINYYIKILYEARYAQIERLDIFFVTIRIGKEAICFQRAMYILITKSRDKKETELITKRAIAAP